jgi:acetylglutamate kinase
MKASQTTAAWPVLDKYRDTCFVVKLGGQPLTDPDSLNSLAFDLSILRQAGIRVVVVHGGGPQLSEMSDRLGLKTKKIDGRRVTDNSTLKLAKMVFAGEVSTDIVAALRRHGVLGIGLSGVDGQLIDAERRAPVLRVNPETGEEELIDFEHVGDVRQVDPSVLNVLLDKGFVPVVASLGSDKAGSVFNINADTVAADLAIAIGAEKLVLLSDVPGLLRDVEDRNSRIPDITVDDIRELKRAGSVSGGMLPKLDSIIRTIESGTEQIHILDGHTPHVLLDELSGPGTHGTFISSTRHAAAVSIGHGSA